MQAWGIGQVLVFRTLSSTSSHFASNAYRARAPISDPSSRLVASSWRLQIWITDAHFNAHFNGYSPALFAESERDLELSQC